MADDLDAPTLLMGGIGADDPLLEALAAPAPAAAAPAAAAAAAVPAAPPPTASVAFTPEAAAAVAPAEHELTAAFATAREAPEAADVDMPSAVGATGAAPAEGKRSFTRAATLDMDGLEAGLSAASGASTAPDAAAAVPTAAARGAPPAGATLRSTNAATAADIELTEASVSVGRDDDANVVLSDPRVSSMQFVIARRAASEDAWVYELEDRSRNGTYVSKRLVKGTKIQLQDQDLVEILPASKVGPASAIAFLFQSSEPAAKRRRVVGDEAATDAIFESATCVICQEVMHRATSAQPCLHSFCSSCLGAWLKKPGDGGQRCPLCRKQVTAAARCPALDGMIEGLLKAYPDRKRLPESLDEMDKNDALKAADYDVAKLRGAGFVGVAGAVPAFGGFPAGMFGGLAPMFGMAMGHGVFGGGGGGGEAASSDEQSSPGDEEAGEAGPPRPPCFHCDAPSWRTLADSAATVAASHHDASRLTKSSFHGNEFECGILEEWAASHGGLGENLRSILVAPNPPGVPAVHVTMERPPAPAARARAEAAAAAAAEGSGGRGAPPGPPPAALPEGAWSELDACKSCTFGVLRAAVYSLRQRIPEAGLPARARGRQDCWYGRGCRTAGHRPVHAAKLNHICVQRRFG